MHFDVQLVSQSNRRESECIVSYKSETNRPSDFLPLRFSLQKVINLGTLMMAREYLLVLKHQ